MCRSPTDRKRPAAGAAEPFMAAAVPVMCQCRKVCGEFFSTGVSHGELVNDILTALSACYRRRLTDGKELTVVRELGSGRPGQSAFGRAARHCAGAELTVLRAHGRRASHARRLEPCPHLRADRPDASVRAGHPDAVQRVQVARERLPPRPRRQPANWDSAAKATTIGCTARAAAPVRARLRPRAARPVQHDHARRRVANDRRIRNADPHGRRFCEGRAAEHSNLRPALEMPADQLSPGSDVRVTVIGPERLSSFPIGPARMSRIDECCGS
jgi:hypothetical protein